MITLDRLAREPVRDDPRLRFQLIRGQALVSSVSVDRGNGDLGQALKMSSPTVSAE